VNQIAVMQARKAFGKNHTAKVTGLTCLFNCFALTRYLYCLIIANKDKSNSITFVKKIYTGKMLIEK
jgi:hypothetical protein